MELKINPNTKIKTYESALKELESQFVRLTATLGIDIKTFDPDSFDPDSAIPSETENLRHYETLMNTISRYHEIKGRMAELSNA